MHRAYTLVKDPKNQEKFTVILSKRRRRVSSTQDTVTQDTVVIIRLFTSPKLKFHVWLLVFHCDRRKHRRNF